jgi:hypothetical protein
MTVIRVSKHAIDRYLERIAPVSREEAHRRIIAHLPAFQVAHKFGAPMVRDGDGVGYLIQGGWVRTVFAPHMRMGPVQ